MALNSRTLEDTLRDARVAQQAWAALPLENRLVPVRRLRARLATEPEILAEIAAREIGKTRCEAIGAEVLPVAEACAFLEDRAAQILAERHETLRGTMPFTGNAIVRHVPWGVVAILVPWNYPLMLCASSALSALVAGNAVVLKASPRAKDTIAAFAEWLWAAGVPKDLLVLLDSSDDSGRAITASPWVNKIVFTGGSRTGRSVLAAAAQNLVPATVELSGCDAVFVLSNADLELAAAAINFGVRINAGRTCICPRRVFVEDNIKNDFIPRLQMRLSQLKLLAPMDPQTLQEADELAIKLLRASGAKSLNNRQAGDPWKAVAVQGGLDALQAAHGNFVPAMVVTSVRDVEEALRLDSASPYALGASIFTRDPEAAVRLASRLRAGFITINECVATAGEACLPFGGSAESGYGVRGGEEGLLEMTRPQTLAFARGTFRPHHLAETEAENLIKALLRARHSDGVFSRLKGWIDYALEAAKWRPPQRSEETQQ